KNTIWIVGDSTVSEFNDNYYYPRYGYGTQFENHFDLNRYDIKNLALSGRSSKSYTKESKYKTLLSGMKEGDYLFIGFGHNDAKFEADRYTNPNGTYKDEGSFANSLYENYIKKAEAAGCKVVLCTPIVRRTSSGKWSNSNLHITSTKGEFEGGNYPEAIRKLGEELNIPVVDLTTMTKELYDKLGAKETLYLHAWNSSDSASVDNTHTNKWGAAYNAYFIAKTVKELDLGDISDAVISESIECEPSKEDCLGNNDDYEESDYDSNLPDSSLWEDVGIWKGTVFGNVGETISKKNFSLGQDADGNINISVKNNKGKISSTSDGIAMYYYKVPVGSEFTLTATAEINSLSKDNQTSFGLMARDEMFIDTHIPDVMGDYVTAAPLKLADEKQWNCFARKSEVLTKGTTVKNTTFEEGSSIDLKIESNPDGYACTLGNETTVTGGFDFALTKIDSKHVYVGMFVSRNADITFKNVKLIIDGKEII
ncbi:MAG: GDSL-type esterase/lipase family protein, partial [Clostridium sp.]